MRWLMVALGAYALALLAQTVQHLLVPQRDGVLAIVQVGAPHLFLPLLLAVPLALVLRRPPAVLALVLLAAVVGLGRFGPGMISASAAAGPDERTLHVATWNLAAGHASTEALLGRLLASDVELIALPELTHAHARAIEGSADLSARYPYRLLMPDASVLGMGLLSTLPLEERSRGKDPPHILAHAQAPGGPIVTLAAHPLPPRFRLAGGLLPIDYHASDRDHDLAHLRSLIEHSLDQGERVLVLGDLNVTDREPAYAEFSRGMLDAHAAAGLGPGSTWRPLRFAGMPFGILRIDYVLTGGPLRPLWSRPECAAATADHCILWAGIALGQP